MATTSNPSPPLHKGRACMNCRRRKVRCDGVKPVCGSCASSESFKDCEYSDTGITRTQFLEERISLLEFHLEELENPDAAGSSVALSDPYAQRGASFSPYSSTSSFLLHGLPDAALDSRISPASDIPPALHQTLIHSFVQHGRQVGLFLNVPRLTGNALGTSSDRLTGALLKTMYLWGAIFSQLSGTQTRSFLQDAIRMTSQQLTLRTMSPRHMLECIQAEVLLANYFFHSARIVEGKYHIASAVSTILSAGLHKFHSSYANTSSTRDAIFGSFTDPMDQGEVIDGFWTVLTLSNCWTAGEPSSLTYGGNAASRIDIPWPLTMAEYSQGVALGGTTHTVQKFLQNSSSQGTSPLALHAKASILFEQSCSLALRYRSDLSPTEMSQFIASFNSLDSLIATFTSTLPRLNTTNSSGALQELLTTWVIALVARIELHKSFLGVNPNSRGRVLSSARAVVEIVRSPRVEAIEFVEPISAVLWASTALTLLSTWQLHREPGRHHSHGAASPDESGEKEMVNSILKAMSAFSNRGCKLMEVQHQRVQNAMKGAL